MVTDAGVILRRARMRANMKLTEMARLVSASSADISQFEHGNRSLGPEQMLRLNECLKPYTDQVEWLTIYIHNQEMRLRALEERTCQCASVL